MRWLIIQGFALAIAVQPLASAALATAPAPASERANAVESCAAKLGTAQVEPREGRAYCACMIDGLEREFGADAVHREVDPNSIQQYMGRMLEIVSHCAHLLPRADSR
ncbi:MAG: hypothetical protein V3T15_05240 [Pseudomonadales bacterium]